MGSADLMPRNLDRRVELLLPIEDQDILQAIKNDILDVHLNDNVQSWCLKSDGHYERVEPGKQTPALNSQMWMLENRGKWDV